MRSTPGSRSPSTRTVEAAKSRGGRVRTSTDFRSCCGRRPAPTRSLLEQQITAALRRPAYGWYSDTLTIARFGSIVSAAGPGKTRARGADRNSAGRRCADRPADRVRQRRQLAARARGATAARDRGSSRARHHPVAAHSPAVRRDDGARFGRGSGRALRWLRRGHLAETLAVAGYPLAIVACGRACHLVRARRRDSRGRRRGTGSRPSVRGDGRDERAQIAERRHSRLTNAFGARDVPGGVVGAPAVRCRLVRKEPVQRSPARSRLRQPASHHRDGELRRPFTIERSVLSEPSLRFGGADLGAPGGVAHRAVERALPCTASVG